MDEHARDGERRLSEAGCDAEPVLHALQPPSEAPTIARRAEPAVPAQPAIPSEPWLPRAAGGGAGAVAAPILLAVQPGFAEAAPPADPEPQPVAPAHETAPEDLPFCEAARPVEPVEPPSPAPAPSQPPLVELIPEVLPTPSKLAALSPSVAPVLRPLQLEPPLPREPDVPAAIAPVAPLPEPIPPPLSEPIPAPQPSPTVALQGEAIPAAPPSPAVTLPLPSPAWPRVEGHHLRVVLRLAITLLAVVAVLIMALLVLYRWVDPPASTLMLGQRLAGTPVSQRWVPLERMSPNLAAAVIASEDGHFCRHHGVDWGELKEAIESSGDGIARGGSTISMQVVKNLFLWPSRSYVRKALEIPLAYAIEALWPKRRILEIYLNIAEWGPGIFGAEAAARYHFRKPALLLTPREASLLAVSLPNPFERQAGRPGPGTLRLADNLLLRMRAAQANTACVRARPDRV